MSTALQTVQLPDWAKNALGDYATRTDVELVLPSLPLSGPGYGIQPTAIMVRIDSDPDAKDVFKVGSRKTQSGWIDLFAYTKQALEKFADAAGIQFRTRRTDDRRDPDYCEFECVAGMRNASGDSVIRSGTAGIRVSQWAEDRWVQIEQSNAKKDPKYQKKESELREDLRGEMAQFRQHFISRCESKAALRTIRSLLAIKSGLTKEQIDKPKIILRNAFQPDASDPIAHQAMIDRGLRNSVMVFGGEVRAEVVEPDQRRAPAELPASVAKLPDDPETARARTGEAAAPSIDPLDYFTEGCRQLGFTAEQRSELLKKHGGDLKSANAELNALANPDGRLI